MQHLGSYDLNLVALSIVVAVLASYTALDLADRISATDGWRRYAWLVAAAFTMGGGIWSMHFVGMLAFALPGMEVSYDWTLTLLSLFLPILVTCLGLLIASATQRGPLRLVISGFIMGLGVVAMHYTGMAAMRMSASLHHQVFWVAVSVVIAISAAIVAMWLAFRRNNAVQRVFAALAMGAAISGMHYSAMQGAIFTYMAPMETSHAPNVGQLSLALWVAGITVAILAVGRTVAFYDRLSQQRAERDASALRQIFETSHLYQWLLTKLGTLQYANKAALSGIGATLDEVLDKRFWDTPWFAGTLGMPETIEDAIRNAVEGKSQSVTLTLNLPGGTRTFDYSFRPVLGRAGKVTAIVPEAADITARLQFEQQLRQAQKMEALGTLTGGVAHDFNNVLMAVLGGLELLRKRLPDDEQLVHRLNLVVEAARRGTGLTQRLLSFARRQDLKPSAVRLGDLVAGMSDLITGAVDKDVTIEPCFSSNIPLVYVDANQLELALLNLVVNARDAMPEAGTITVGCFTPSETTEDDGGKSRFVCVYVRDTGQGMDKETLAHAQEPFFTTKGVGKGTGLGLAMVRSFAEQAGGRFVLKSQLGKGTTAEIWLPRIEATSDDARLPTTGG